MYKFLYPQNFVYQSLCINYITYTNISQYQNYTLKFPDVKKPAKVQALAGYFLY